MLFELRGFGPLDGPVAAVVDARGDLVDDGAAGAREILHGQHPDMAKGAGNAVGGAAGLLELRPDGFAGRDGGAAQDAVAVLVTGRVPKGVAAVSGAREDHG